MSNLCERCGDRAVTVCESGRRLCDSCYELYVNCAQCKTLIYIDNAIPVYNHKPYGKGFVGLEGVYCEECASGC